MYRITKPKPDGTLVLWKGRLQPAVEIALQTITIAKESVPLEPVKGALGSLAALLNLLQVYLENEDDLKEIAERCQRVAEIVERASKSKKLQQNSSVMEDVANLKTIVDRLRATIEEKNKRSKIMRFISAHSDTRDIDSFKENLRDFLDEFQAKLDLVSTEAVLRLVDLQLAQQVHTTSPGFSTPPRPPIFFGRDDVVKAIVETVTPANGGHVALIGTGGIGKTSVAKAVLNEALVAAAFEARLFITFDGVDAAAISYQFFLDRISIALNLTSTDARGILQRLSLMSAVLVIDNAETFLDSAEVDRAKISEMLDAMGAQSGTRIILTTRNQELISPNLIWKRLQIAGISLEAACNAFSAVYSLCPLDDGVKAILTELEYHPLSINILANAASMNEWTMEQIQKVWSERQVGVLENANDKYRSLRVAIELSLSAFRSKEIVLELLQSIALLPQGIYGKDLIAIFPAVFDITQQAESILRASLIYRRDDRLTMLAPIRMYIAQRDSEALSYNGPILSTIRLHYYRNFVRENSRFMKREQANLEALLSIEMTSTSYRRVISKIHLYILGQAHLLVLYSSSTSLWQLLISEAQDATRALDSAMVLQLGATLLNICWAEYKHRNHTEALKKAQDVEKFLQAKSPMCNLNPLLVECLRLQGIVYQLEENFSRAENVLRRAIFLAWANGLLPQTALINHTLSSVLLSMGNISEAASLSSSAAKYFTEKNKHVPLISALLDQSKIAVLNKDFTKAIRLVEQARMKDQQYNDSKMRLALLVWRASCEGGGDDIAAAIKTLDEATEVDTLPPSNSSAFSRYVDAFRGKAYYQARLKKSDNVVTLIAHVESIASAAGWKQKDSFTKIVAIFDTLLSGEKRKAKLRLDAMLRENDGNNKRWSAHLHRLCGEFALVVRDKKEANFQFSAAKALCDKTGLSAKFLGAELYTWLKLPSQYDGWDRYLAGTL